MLNLLRKYLNTSAKETYIRDLQEEDEDSVNKDSVNKDSVFTESFNILEKKNSSIIIGVKEKEEIEQLLYEDIIALPVKEGIKANRLRVSFHNRFLRSKKRTLYKKTVIQNYNKPLKKADAEELYVKYLDKLMLKVERKERFKRYIRRIYTTFVPMSNRSPDKTCIFVTHKFKNTFVTIFRGKAYTKGRYGMKVTAKVSAGGIGYKGPKKSTVFARKSVIKEAGLIAAGSLTSFLDVIFTSHVSRWNRKAVRDLSPNLSYVNTIQMHFSRPHGFRKLKNKRRV